MFVGKSKRERRRERDEPGEKEGGGFRDRGMLVSLEKHIHREHIH
jgi:hypothetical protein